MCFVYIGYFGTWFKFVHAVCHRRQWRQYIFTARGKLLHFLTNAMRKFFLITAVNLATFFWVVNNFFDVCWIFPKGMSRKDKMEWKYARFLQQALIRLFRKIEVSMSIVHNLKIKCRISACDNFIFVIHFYSCVVSQIIMEHLWQEGWLIL